MDSLTSCIAISIGRISGFGARNLADGLLTLLALRASHYNQAVTRREVVAFVVVAVQPSAVVRGRTDSDAEGGSPRVRR